LAIFSFGCVLLFSAEVWAKAPKEPKEKKDITVFRYTDSSGGAVFTDKALSGSKYKLIWRTTLSRLDASFERAPHLPLASTESQKSTSSHNRQPRQTRFSALIAKIARQADVNVHLLHAVIQAESAYNPNAKSPAGARGLMQLMPATAKRYGVTDILDPEQNLSGGARYLRDLLELFENNMRLAVAAYNAGEGAVLKYGRQIPPYRETREYVRRVIANFERRQG
jgi:soluble lytic murein transglycosylase-like protein